MAEMKRIDIGFQGGQTLAVRAEVSSYEELEKSLGDEKSSRWHNLETDDSSILIDLAQIVYIRRDSGTQKVGF